MRARSGGVEVAAASSWNAAYETHKHNAPDAAPAEHGDYSLLEATTMEKERFSRAAAAASNSERRQAPRARNNKLPSRHYQSRHTLSEKETPRSITQLA